MASSLPEPPLYHLCGGCDLCTRAPLPSLGGCGLAGESPKSNSWQISQLTVCPPLRSVLRHRLGPSLPINIGDTGFKFSKFSEDLPQNRDWNPVPKLFTTTQAAVPTKMASERRTSGLQGLGC